MGVLGSVRIWGEFLRGRRWWVGWAVGRVRCRVRTCIRWIWRRIWCMLRDKFWGMLEWW